MAASENVGDALPPALAKISTLFRKKPTAAGNDSKRLRKLAGSLAIPRKSVDGGPTPEQQSSNSFKALSGIINVHV